MKISLIVWSASLTFFASSTPLARADTVNHLQAAFIRNGDLWTISDHVEKPLTQGREASFPKWSFDGQWLAYEVTKDSSPRQQDRALHVRNVRTNQDVVVAWAKRDSDFQAAWAPNRNVLAFQIDSILNDIDMTHLREQGFHNVSLGVERFAWLPDGDGFLVSSSAHLRPDGWTHAVLYKVLLRPGYSGSNTVKRFFILPKEVTVGGKKVIAIGTSAFKWSADGKWIAFIVHPTASWSMDSDVLCVLSNDGKQFIPVAAMLQRDDWFAWAPGAAKLAFIEGAGRFITEHKHLGIAFMPQFHAVTNFTPDGFVDNAFTWTDDASLITSRARAGDYNAKLPAEQLPSLYKVDMRNRNVRKLTSPQRGFGDYQPLWNPQCQQLIWLRAGQHEASVLVGNIHAHDKPVWINHIAQEPWTPYWSMWHKLIDIQCRQPINRSLQ